MAAANILPVPALTKTGSMRRKNLIGFVTLAKYGPIGLDQFCNRRLKSCNRNRYWSRRAHRWRKRGRVCGGNMFRNGGTEMADFPEPNKPKPPFKFDLGDLQARARRQFNNRFGGFTVSLPFFTFTVNPNDREQQIAREIVIRLKDRRVLSAWECCDDCIDRALASLQEERVVELVGPRRSPTASRMVVLPTSPPPRMILTPLAGCHERALMPRKRLIAR
jgi:hypothetical protein